MFTTKTHILLKEYFEMEITTIPMSKMTTPNNDSA